MNNQIISLLIVLGVSYVGIVNLAYFLFNPFFNNKISYWSCYTLQFKDKFSVSNQR